MPTRNQFLFVDHSLILGLTQSTDSLLFNKLDYVIPLESLKVWNNEIVKSEKKVWVIDHWDTAQLVKLLIVPMKFCYDSV